MAKKRKDAPDGGDAEDGPGEERPPTGRSEGERAGDAGEAFVTERKSDPEAQVRFAGTVIFLIVALVFFAKTFRVEEVRAEQIGFIVNNWTGEVTEVKDAGNVVFCGLWNDFHTIENRNLSMDMGAVAGDNDLMKLKTLDGNDVYVDFTIFYQLVPDKAMTVLAENGSGAEYELHWIRDYGRAIVRYVLGELTTEQFYVAEERDRKTRLAEKEINALLEPHGIRVTQIAIQKFSYNPEYEKKITDKKLADQEVEQWRSVKAANEQRQAQRTGQSQQEAQNGLTRYKGELDQKLEEAKGEADRIRRESEGYAKQVTLKAEAAFHKLSNEAQALRAQMEAEAAGVRALRDAMSGDGGRNLVAIEYARKLRGVKVTGKPIVFTGEVTRFSHQGEPGEGTGEATSEAEGSRAKAAPAASAAPKGGKR